MILFLIALFAAYFPLKVTFLANVDKDVHSSFQKLHLLMKVIAFLS